MGTRLYLEPHDHQQTKRLFVARSDMLPTSKEKFPPVSCPSGGLTLAHPLVKLRVSRLEADQIRTNCA
jgi:hypothetical protein